MILTCPQCSSRFLLPATSLGAEGRHVKCSSCGEVWHQLPDPEEMAELEAPIEEAEEQQDIDEAPQEDDFEDIPESVKPAPEDDDAQAASMQEDEEEGQGAGDIRAELIQSLPAAAAIFVLVFAVLIAVNRPIAAAFPSMSGFYGAVGISIPVPGEGLVFDRLYAKTKAQGEHEVLTIGGKIINLTSDEQAVPVIEARIRNEAGEDIDVLNIKPTAKTIDKEGTQDFEVAHEMEHNGSYNVALRFVIKPEKKAKTVSGGDDNMHAPPQGAQADPHGGAAHGESPAHVSAH